jgi:hypothetical protein
LYSVTIGLLKTPTIELPKMVGSTEGLAHLFTVSVRSGDTYLGKRGAIPILTFLWSLIFTIGLIKFATKYMEGLVFKLGICCLSSTPVAVFKL